MTFRETIPKEALRVARPTNQGSRALKAGGTDMNKTWGSRYLLEEVGIHKTSQ